uniref:G_PROTEIN_RECEP_F1_2 domain-containing protein n=1 Tax=Heterorhabditis bacteriophora TaxID=37862 RepID=A0A1I7X5T6_HETBA
MSGEYGFFNNMFDKDYEMSDSSQHLRLALTVTHLLLVALGSVNLIVVLLIFTRPFLRSITNVYMVGLCLADFIYLTDLILVAATSLNLKSWPFGTVLCHLYHGTETTGKYASVLFVVLLAADRYFAMCKSDVCARYRYISACSIVIFILPGLVIFYCYYHVFCKLREAAKYYLNFSVTTLRDNSGVSLMTKLSRETPSVFVPDEDSVTDVAEKQELERKRQELSSWRPYDGTNGEILEIHYDHHKCSTKSIVVPAVTITYHGGTKL